MRGLEGIGYKIMDDPTVIVAFTSEDINLFGLCDEMAKKGCSSCRIRAYPT